MRLPLLFFVAVLCPSLMFAQAGGRITGRVLDKTDKHPLEGTTITALNKQSGKFITYAVSNTKGEFSIGGLPQQETFELFISFTGYRDTSSFYTVTSKKIKASGDWMMEPASDEMEAVTIVRRLPPFVIKKDTIEFNATAFKSLPSDMVQDLLRKLPGVVVDQDGNVTVNGQKVNKIRVDGRDFFGGNLRMSMENLPGAIIDKIQVMETREPLQARNSIIQPIEKNITLNLVLKKKNRKGLFGLAGAGAGTKERYQAHAMINSFNEGNRMSLYGNTGNSSASGSGMMMMGLHRMKESAGAGEGILNNNTQGGINYNDRIGKNTQFDGTYTVSSSDQENNRILRRTNILPDSSFKYNSDAETKSKQLSHQFASNFNIKIDTLQQLLVSPSFEYSDRSNDAVTVANSESTTGKPINSQLNHNENSGAQYSFNNKTRYNRISRSRNTVFNAGWTFGLGRNKNKQYNRSENIFYQASGLYKDSLDQYGNTTGSDFSNNIELQLNHSFGKNFTAIAGYQFMQSNNKSDKALFDFNPLSGKHDLPDTAFSNSNNNRAVTHLPSISLGYHHKKISAEIGAGIRKVKQQNELPKYDSTILIQQHNFSPRLTLAYDLAAQARVILNYSLESQAPDQDQLAPLPDNSNPLYIRTGNPALRTAFMHVFHTGIEYSTRDYKWRAALRGSGSVTENAIVEDSYFDSSGRQLSSFRNVDGQQQYSMTVNAGRRWISGKWSLNFDLNTNFSNIRASGFVNQLQNETQTFRMNTGLSAGLNYERIFMVFGNLLLDYNRTNYSVEGLNDLSYNTKRLELFSNITPVKKLRIINSVFYLFNSQLPESLQRSRTLWNAFIGYGFLKNERLTVMAGVNDMLDNNSTTSQTISPTSVELTSVTALRRNAMVSVSYRLSSFNAMKL